MSTAAGALHKLAGMGARAACARLGAPKPTARAVATLLWLVLLLLALLCAALCVVLCVGLIVAFLFALPYATMLVATGLVMLVRRAVATVAPW